MSDVILHKCNGSFIKYDISCIKCGESLELRISVRWAYNPWGLVLMGLDCSGEVSLQPAHGLVLMGLDCSVATCTGVGDDVILARIQHGLGPAGLWEPSGSTGAFRRTGHCNWNRPFKTLTKERLDKAFANTIWLNL